MAKKPDTFDRVQAQVDELRALLGDISSRLIGDPTDPESAQGEGDDVIDLRDRSETRRRRIIDLRDRRPRS